MGKSEYETCTCCHRSFVAAGSDVGRKLRAENRELRSRLREVRRILEADQHFMFVGLANDVLNLLNPRKKVRR